MTDPPDFLTRALGAFGPAPPVPAALPARVTAAMQLEDARLTRVSRRNRAMRRVSLVAAAAFVCGAAALLWPGDSAAQQAVAKAAQKMREAKGVKAVTRTTIQGHEEPAVTRYAVASKERIESKNTVTITDAAVGVKLELDSGAKTAKRSLLASADIEKFRREEARLQVTDLFGEYKKEYGADLVAGPDEVIDGRKAKVFSLRGDMGLRSKLFIDAETEVLLRIVESHRNSVEQIDLTLLDADPDPKLFDLAVPPEYTLLDPAAKPKPVADEYYAHSMQRLLRIQSLRLTAVWDDNRGPDTRTAPRVHHQTLTLSGPVSRLDLPSLPGMPGLKLGGETIEQTYLSDSSVKPERLLYVNHVTRRAWPKATLVLPYVDLRKYLTDLAAAPGQPVGMDRVGGAACDVYSLADTGTLVWVSRETELPARISIREKEHLVAVLERFDYAPAIDPALLDFAPPAGYDVVNR